MPNFEVIIVGAGIVGLAAAIGLADKGHKVKVSLGAALHNHRSSRKVLILDLGHRSHTNPPGSGRWHCCSR